MVKKFINWIKTKWQKFRAKDEDPLFTNENIRYKLSKHDMHGVVDGQEILWCSCRKIF